jgi:hypothetical protein
LLASGNVTPRSLGAEASCYGSVVRRDIGRKPYASTGHHFQSWKGAAQSSPAGRVRRSADRRPLGSRRER